MEEQLDRLFDITKCRCPILSCQEANCLGCPTSSNAQLPPCHITCTCAKEQKIPALEVSFILVQRQKVGGKSSWMIGHLDKKESSRQALAYQRNEKEKLMLAKKRKEDAKKDVMEVDRLMEELTDGEQIETEEDEDSYERDPNYSASGSTESSMCNKTNIRNIVIGIASIRYGTSSNATAAIANATMLDYGVISKDNAQTSSTS